MKILWITNVLLPEAKLLISKDSVFRGSGGWILALAEKISQQKETSLHIASITNLVDSYKIEKGKLITYHLIPLSSNSACYCNKYEDVYRNIYDTIHPDIVHIHGTEYPNSLAALNACGVKRTVVSLQGIVSVIAPMYLGGITKKDILSNLTFHDIVRPGLLRQQRDMKKRGKYEVQLLNKVRYVIGRTSWDKTHVWAINPYILYFHCDEILRKEFYENYDWSYDNCTPHSLFVSQGSYPLKGLHILIGALGIVKKHYPDVQLRVAGRDITFSKWTCSDRFRISTYGHIIKKLIVRNNLQDNIQFTGNLTAEKMREEYLKANLFVCPSIIENSPNSLGEAQILGVPVIASYVGGVPDMMKGNEDNLYRFEDMESLANKICCMFKKTSKIDTSGVQTSAANRHSQECNVINLIKIYKEVSEG